MKHVITAIICFTFAFLPRSAFADGQVRPRLFLHGTGGIGERTMLVGEFILPNVLAPSVVAEVGLDREVDEYFGIGGYGGFDFAAEQGILSLRLNPHWDDFYIYSITEVTVPDGGAYLFTQFEWIAPLGGNWLHLGVSQETWGSYPDFDKMNFGAGPNVLLRLGDHFGLDHMFMVRGIEGNDGVERPGLDYLLIGHAFL